MTIDISKHYFHRYANTSKVNRIAGFSVGEIVTDWHGDTGCILTIHENGDVRTDSNGMGHIGDIKKVRSRKKIEAYLNDLHKADMEFLLREHEYELNTLRQSN